MRMFRIMLASMGALYTVSSVAAIEEIVVTAQKRTESIQDVPISITAFSGDELARRGFERPAGSGPLRAELRQCRRPNNRST